VALNRNEAIGTFNRKVEKLMVSSQKRNAKESCHRCGGFMVPVEIREANIQGWRCVMCGEHIDSLILEHRRQMQAAEQSGRPVGDPELAEAQLN
jgi:hypothetical protein